MTKTYPRTKCPVCGQIISVYANKVQAMQKLVTHKTSMGARCVASGEKLVNARKMSGTLPVMDFQSAAANPVRATVHKINRPGLMIDPDDVPAADAGAGETCPFCRVRKICTDALTGLEDVHEIGAELYDGYLSELYNAADEAKGRFRCYCDDPNLQGKGIDQ